jgi:hypothetical protein
MRHKTRVQSGECYSEIPAPRKIFRTPNKNGNRGLGSTESRMSECKLHSVVWVGRNRNRNLMLMFETVNIRTPFSTYVYAVKSIITCSKGSEICGQFSTSGRICSVLLIRVRLPDDLITAVAKRMLIPKKQFEEFNYGAT